MIHFFCLLIDIFYLLLSRSTVKGNMGGMESYFFFSELLK